MLDLRDTFEFTSIADPDSVDETRADYTIEILRLNERDYLIDARFNAFSSFHSRLYEYVDRKNNGASQDELDLKQEGIRRSPHPTVWAEMKRQRNAYPQLSELFDAAPEALAFSLDRSGINIFGSIGPGDVQKPEPNWRFIPPGTRGSNPYELSLIHI